MTKFHCPCRKGLRKTVPRIWAVFVLAILIQPISVVSTPLPTNSPIGTLSNSGPVASDLMIANSLLWDRVMKEYTATTNETEAKVSFNVTNVSTGEVIIRTLKPSCGCTVARMPQTPWRLAPGESGEIQVVTNLRAKRGTLNKVVLVDSTAGLKVLRFKIRIPDPPDGAAAAERRSRNQQAAQADRQSVLRGDCATCHTVPALGKTGAALYDAACEICHQTEQRASMVPDLNIVRRRPTGPGYWRTWINQGRAGTLMPAFAQSEGGPLTKEQVDSLVEFLQKPLEGDGENLAPSSGAPGN
jgi:mono/diheme cytochrome c family protein